MKKRILLIVLCVVMCLFTNVASAHSGRTDANGGHYNRSTGEYHYHHGYSAHQHYDMDGDGIIDCPYEFKDNTNHGNTSNGNISNSEYTITDKKTENNSEPLIKPTFGDILIIILKIIGSSLMLLLMGFLVWMLVYAGLKLLLLWICEKILKRDANTTIISIISTIIIVVVAIIISSIIVLSSEGIL